MEWCIIFPIMLIIHKGICSEMFKPNIAIIGGGIGGASSSHFLTELFKNDLNIDLYEAKNIGGRLATVQINDKEFEAGGTIIHHNNRYMQEFVKLLGLEHRPKGHERGSIWDGNEIIFKESEWKVLTLVKLIYRYGIQPFSLNRYITSVLNHFEEIYRLQDTGKSFTNISSFLSAINSEYPKSLQKSIKNALLNLGYSERVINELVRTTLVVNYGQDTDVHSFVGFVSLAGGVGSNLWSVKGGNKKVPEHLIYRNKHVNVVPSRVTKIVNIPTNDSKNLYEVHYHNKDSTTIMKETYNIVILAIPLTLDQKYPIIFEGFPNNDFYSLEQYHQTVATLVKADLNPHYFGLEKELDVILSCDPMTIVSAVGRLNSVEGTMTDSNVWKIFSKEPLKSAIINEMFSNVQEIKEIIWKAYPEYSTRIHETKFKLHNALYNVNAIEWIASAMEMSAIGGRNVALLAYEDFSSKFHYKKFQNLRSFKENTQKNSPKSTPPNEL